MPEKGNLPAHRGLPQDAHARAVTVRLLRVLAAASLLVPLALFGFASWVSLRDMRALADERIARSLDVMDEQALTVALDAIQRWLGTRSAAELSMDEPQLHADGFLGRMGTRKPSPESRRP